MKRADGCGTKGRIGELQAAVLLEQPGFPTVDMTSRDYGKDLTVQIPMKPLNKDILDNLAVGETGDRWDLSHVYSQIQVKNSPDYRANIDELGA